MTMIFRRVETPGIAQLSYLLGDDKTGTAAVIDPRPDVDIYLELAREHGVTITHIFETHIHADFMSGSRALAARLGGADLCVSGEGGAEYGFEVEKIQDGAEFEFGSALLTARFTPGHTPEHLSYVVAEKKRRDTPWGVFSGDSLFVGSAGRPDLLGEDQTEELVEQLFHTLRDFYLKLDDGVIVYPCHGAGSACGADIGDRPMSTIGYERQFNDFLQIKDFKEFKEFVKQGAPPIPHHYKRLKKTNGKGPEVLSGLPPVPGLTVEAFRAAVERGDAQLVDTRSMLAFGGGHIPGAINIGGQQELPVWAGEMLSAEKPILLVVETPNALADVVWHMVNTGFTRFAGYLAGGMKAWSNAGLPLKETPQVTVHEVRENADKWQLLDVRSPSEWKSGHMPKAKHYYVADLRNGNGLPDLRKDKPLVVYCGSGYRASIAASILESRGYQDVRNVPGSWQAWTKTGYPVEK